MKALLDDRIRDAARVEQLKPQDLSHAFPRDPFRRRHGLDHRADPLHVHVTLALLDATRSHEHEFRYQRRIFEGQLDAERAAVRIPDHGAALDSESSDETAERAEHERKVVIHVLGLARVSESDRVGNDCSESALRKVRKVPLEVAEPARPGTATVDEDDRSPLPCFVIVDPKSLADVLVLALGHCAGAHGFSFGRGANAAGGWWPHSLILSYVVGRHVASSTSRPPHPNSN